MKFTDATDQLRGPTQEDVAAACGVSVSTVKQARMDPGNRNHRAPPPGWQAAIARLAERRAAELLTLARVLRGET